MRPRPILAALASLALVPPLVRAQAIDLAPAVDARIGRFMTDRTIPGLTVAIAVGPTIWTKGYGLADVENGVPATPETVYRFASISKPITAVAALSLARQGRLDLDADVRTYVPTFPAKPWPVTPRRLLGHLGGIRDYRGDEALSARRYRDLTAPLAIFRDDPLVHEPGTAFLYSTYGYNLLGAAVEGAAGRPFRDVLRAEVFTPAGMASTRDDDAVAILPHRAQGYRLGEGGRLENSALVDVSNKIPGGGLCGTAADVARFANALMDGTLIGPVDASPIHTPGTLPSGASTGYALGWSITQHRGEREASHGGNQPRVSTFLYTRPARRQAVVVLTNLEGLDNPARLDLARALADAIPAALTTPGPGRAAP